MKIPSEIPVNLHTLVYDNPVIYISRVLADVTNPGVDRNESNHYLYPNLRYDLYAKIVGPVLRETRWNGVYSQFYNRIIDSVNYTML